MESNLFMALRMEQNEVVMCRFLADLLDPQGLAQAQNAVFEILLTGCCPIKRR